MTIDRLFEQAERSWPPPPEAVRDLCNRIGTRGYIGRELLHLGDYGPKRVSAWIAGHDQIPFSVWFMLLVVDHANENPND